MRVRNILVAASALLLGMQSFVSFAQSATQSYRPAEGTEVHFIVPVDASIVTVDANTGESGDVIIFTGKSVGLMSLFPQVVAGDECGEQPVVYGQIQSATVVDPGDHRATRLMNQIAVTYLPLPTSGVFPPLTAGTRLSDIVFDRECRVDFGVRFRRYRAVVQ